MTYFFPMLWLEVCNLSPIVCWVINRTFRISLCSPAQAAITRHHGRVAETTEMCFSVLEAVKSTISKRKQSPSRAVLRVARGPERRGREILVSPVRTLILSDQDPNLMTLFNINFLLLGSMSKYRHTGR